MVDLNVIKEGRIFKILKDDGLWERKRNSQGTDALGGQPTPLPSPPSAGERIATLKPGTLIRVKQILFDAQEVTRKDGADGCLFVTTEIDGEMKTGVVWAVYQSVEYIALAGAQVEIKAGVQTKRRVVLRQMPVGPVIGQTDEEIKQRMNELLSGFRDKRNYDLQSDGTWIAKDKGQWNRQATELTKLINSNSRSLKPENGASGTGAIFHLRFNGARLPLDLRADFQISKVWKAPDEGETFHNGIDITGPKGKPVRAVEDGSVLEVKSNTPWGNYVRISHVEGVDTLYAHLDKTLVEKGHDVVRGQVIGTVGESDLHFAIFRGEGTSDSRDPLTFDWRMALEEEYRELYKAIATIADNVRTETPEGWYRKFNDTDHADPNGCLGFARRVVRAAFGGVEDSVLKLGNADAAYRQAKADSRLIKDISIIPDGAVVFFSNAGKFHVAISRRGKVIGFGKNGQIGQFGINELEGGWQPKAWMLPVPEDRSKLKGTTAGHAIVHVAMDVMEDQKRERDDSLYRNPNEKRDGEIVASPTWDDYALAFVALVVEAVRGDQKYLSLGDSNHAYDCARKKGFLFHPPVVDVPGVLVFWPNFDKDTKQYKKGRGYVAIDLGKGQDGNPEFITTTGRSWANTSKIQVMSMSDLEKKLGTQRPKYWLDPTQIDDSKVCEAISEIFVEPVTRQQETGVR
ncbi:M23 family metallopeptidase [Candidatus Poribacteria bacterium]|nr:M23 family metallopeptidase [Candidatus Poribacteria bacterium]